MMFEILRQWPHWPLLRFVTGFLVALATTVTVGFAIWTHHARQAATRLAKLQETRIFRIVNDSRESGIAFADVKAKYLTHMPEGQLPTLPETVDDHIQATLLRLAPAVRLVRDRWYTADRAPLSDLKVFVEDIAFGIPQIPDAYRDRSLTDTEVARLLAPIRDSPETVRLTQPEADRLNRIIDLSNQAASWRVSPDVTYTTDEIVEHFESAFRDYYDYSQWKDVVRRWARFLAEPDMPPVQRIHAFVANEVMSVPRSSTLFSNLTGMAVVRYLDEDLNLASLSPVDNDCSESESTLVTFHHPPDGTYGFNWGRMTSTLGDSDDMFQRQAAALKLAALFSKACTMTLSRVFASAGVIFDREHRLMEEALTAWNSILQDREPATLQIRATISNAGQFDTYIRREIRAAVGPPAAQIPLTLASTDHGGVSADQGPYLLVRTRTPNTYTFRTELGRLSDRVYGTFQSRFASIRVRVLPILDENVVVSPATPFSPAARLRAREQIDDTPIGF